MKKLLSRFDVLMSAITFAEAGEADTAREMIREDDDARRKAKDNEYPEALISTGAGMAKG